MTSNIFKKERWSESDKKIYINNLKLLCECFDLKNKEFSKLVGVANAFRKDVKPSQSVVLNICREFNVTENWLSTDRIGDNIGIAEEIKVQVSEQQLQYSRMSPATIVRQSLIDLVNKIIDSENDLLIDLLYDFLNSMLRHANAESEFNESEEGGRIREAIDIVLKRNG